MRISKRPDNSTHYAEIIDGELITAIGSDFGLICGFGQKETAFVFLSDAEVDKIESSIAKYKKEKFGTKPIDNS